MAARSGGAAGAEGAGSAGTGDDRLAIYLNDHLGGATAGIQLARRCEEREAGTELGRHLEGLRRAIEEDRDVLRQVMDRVHAPTNTAKQVGAIATELASRLKHKLPVVGSGTPDVARLEDIELLSLGIEGKRLMWRALAALAPSDARLGEFDFGLLGDRAQSQREGLEPFRVELGTTAFGR